jgi:uncharacterized protein (DUF2147 family)
MILICTLFFAASINAQALSEASKDKLKGSWLRTDGTYTVEIIALEEGGNLSAKYFNPDPIHVAKAGWRIFEDETQIYVELQDTNYPGCMYRLSYNENSDMLSGTYYQPVSKQTFKVDFKKNN